MMYRFVLFAGLFVWATVVSQAVIAAEVKVLSANVFTGVLDSVFSDFERSSGHKVLFECVTAGKVRDRAQADEFDDVAIATRTITNDLQHPRLFL